MSQQHRIGKELGQDAEKDPTYQKRTKGIKKDFTGWNHLEKTKIKIIAYFYQINSVPRLIFIIQEFQELWK